MRELEGKVAVVTGGGSGIGAAVGKACHAEGMTVAVVDIDRQRAFAVADEIDETGERSRAFGVDVADAHAVDALAAEVFARFAGCHLLHNNAGLCPMGRAWDHSAEEWRHVIGVNLLGVAHGVNAFVPRMLDQSAEAHIVNTVSAAALNTPERVAELVLEGVRDNEAYIITHPGSLEAVSARHAGIQASYQIQHDRHPELP
jgi:NAD(P)-dependent dehydrogenase (short-subunit alcohol dehydrogenase family)